MKTISAFVIETRGQFEVRMPNTRTFTCAREELDARLREIAQSKKCKLQVTTPKTKWIVK